MRLNWIALVAVGASIAAGAAQAVTFSDGQFDDADWTFLVDTANAGGIAVVVLEPTGGVPGAFRRHTVTTNVGTFATVLHYGLRNDAVWDPAVDGAIGSIDYSEHAIAYIAPGIGPGGGAALMQGGKLYFANPNGDLHTTSSTWISQSASGLTAIDFRTAADPNDHPDFTTSGALVTFGYTRHTGNGGSAGPVTVEGGIDNWQIAVHPPMPTPTEEQSWSEVKRGYSR